MRLVDLVRKSGRRLVVPLAGFPGTALTGSSIKQNGFNAELQYRSLYKLAELTQPDAQFVMMDLSVEANALGLPVRFPLHDSATVEWHPVEKAEDLDQYRAVDPLADGRVWVFLETIRRLVDRLTIPVGGYAIGPFTLAGLMFGAQRIALATLDTPELVKSALDFCEQIIVRYAKAQVEAGAKIIMMLEPTAVLLGPNMFWEFSGRSVRQIFRHLDCMTVLHICGDTTAMVEPMCKTEVHGLSLDSMLDMPAAAARMPGDVVLMGNVDPVNVLLRGAPADVERATRDLLDRTAGCENFILSSGCDIPAEAPLANLKTFVHTGKQHCPAHKPLAQAG